MNEKKRMTLMLALVVVLIIANGVVHLTGDSQNLGFFNAGEDLDDTYSLALKRKMTQLEALPALSFQPPERVLDDSAERRRNPFMFGRDKRVEQKHRQRMEALARARQEEQAQAAVVPPPPPKPAFSGTLLGVMRNRNNGETRISLSFEQEIHVVAVGDVFAGRYRLDKVGQTHIRLTQTADGEVIEVPIESR